MNHPPYQQTGPYPRYKLVTVQITMEEPLRDALRLRAQFLGFDTIQAYVRFWALAEAEGRKIDLEVHGWEPQAIYGCHVMPALVARLRYAGRST